MRITHTDSRKADVLSNNNMDQYRLVNSNSAPITAPANDHALCTKSNSNKNNNINIINSSTSSNSSSSSNSIINYSSNSNYLTNSLHSKLSRSNQLKNIIGLVYIQEYLPNGLGVQKGSDEVSIGTLILAEQRTLYANHLRQMIVQQSLFNMDNNYIFLTNFGSPISIAQEISIELKYLLNDQNNIKFKRDHSQLRCPVIGQQPSGNYSTFIGYVLSSYDTDLKSMRVKIEEVLRDYSQVNNQKLSSSFHFIHSLHHSVCRYNEANILLVDILQNKCIFIRFDVPLDSYAMGSIAIQDKFLSNEDINFPTAHAMEDQVDLSKPKPTKKPSILRRRTFKLQKSALKNSQKQIMISYARQEAADHALKLKESLFKLGYSVYLDVHEIEMGSDWQDSLNNAIQNCRFFVPLITPMYGRTQWTNREVKLADVLRKHIIPINFLDIWPPECLAIQFATTQYILWRSTTDDPKEKDVDKKAWDQQSIEDVTKQLVDQIIKMDAKTKRESKIASAPSQLDSKPERAVVVKELTETSTHSAKNPLVVISAHPNQHLISNEIAKILAPDYQVWCSNDLTENFTHRIQEETQTVNYRDSTYDPNLSPIIEETAPTLPHAIQDYARKIAENSKQRPKSVPNSEHSEFKLEKNPLSRVVSYNGEGTSYHSSITPDKMERLKAFQEKVLSSSLVIIIASEQYYKSRTSEQHVYYCGQRKKTILVQCDKSEAPVWFSKLMSQDTPLNYYDKNFDSEIRNKIKRTLDPAVKHMEQDFHEIMIKNLTDCMKKNLPNIETCVYVLGSSGVKHYENQRTVEICTEIGKQLAQVANINIVTNGFYGTSDIVALNFVGQRKNNLKDPNESSVIHIVPVKDNKDYSDKCRQDKDGNFEKVSYGQTFFLGETIRMRDSAIARLMDTCILIEGDQDTAHEIEEFIWNDHFVVPVCSTGGAAAGDFGVPSKIFQCPNGVDENDWAVLSNADATPNEVAKAVVHVICGLKQAIHEHAASKNVRSSTLKKSNSEKPQKKRTAARKRLNINIESQKTISAEEEYEKLWEPGSPEKLLPIHDQSDPQSDDSSKGSNRIKKLTRRFAGPVAVRMRFRSRTKL